MSEVREASVVTHSPGDIRPVRARGCPPVIAAAATATALVAVAGLVISIVMTRSSPASTGQAPGEPPTNWAQPLIHGEKTTVAGAQAAVGFTVAVPNDPAASRGDLTQTWVEAQPREVALVFDRGKVDIMMGPAIYRDPASFFKKFSAEMDAKTAIMQVNGHPALVITPHTDPNNPNPAWVEFDRNGIDINIASTAYGTSVLLRIADSMH